jgi:N-acetylneuraminic acid mutarotase
MDLASPAKSWTSFPSMPLEVAYIGLAFVPAINRLYAIGGESGTSGFSRNVMKYDFSTNIWTTSGQLNLNLSL